MPLFPPPDPLPPTRCPFPASSEVIPCRGTFSQFLTRACGPSPQFPPPSSCAPTPPTKGPTSRAHFPSPHRCGGLPPLPCPHPRIRIFSPDLSPKTITQCFRIPPPVLLPRLRPHSTSIPAFMDSSARDQPIPLSGRFRPTLLSLFPIVPSKPPFLIVEISSLRTPRILVPPVLLSPCLSHIDVANMVFSILSVALLWFSPKILHFPSSHLLSKWLPLRRNFAVSHPFSVRCLEWASYTTARDPPDLALVSLEQHRPQAVFGHPSSPSSQPPVGLVPSFSNSALAFTTTRASFLRGFC